MGQVRVWVVFASMVACARATPMEPPQPTEAEEPGVKAPGNLPVRTRAELRDEADAREACFAACDQGDERCQTDCDHAHPPIQVEVVPELTPPR